MTKNIKVDCEELVFHAWDLKDIGLCNKPGVYVLWDIKQQPVYVGKANNIGSRVTKHIRAQTKELARNKKNYTTKTEYRYIYGIQLFILNNPHDSTWFEAYKICEHDPVFNYEMRTDLEGNTPRKRKKSYENMKNEYLDKNYERMRGSEDSYWTLYENEIMHFLMRAKKHADYGLGVEDVIFNKIYHSSSGKLITLSDYAKSIPTKKSIRDIVISDIRKVSSWSDDQIIEKAKKIAKQTSAKSLDVMSLFK